MSSPKIRIMRNKNESVLGLWQKQMKKKMLIKKIEWVFQISRTQFKISKHMRSSNICIHAHPHKHIYKTSNNTHISNLHIGCFKPRLMMIEKINTNRGFSIALENIHVTWIFKINKNSKVKIKSYWLWKTF